MEQELCFIKEPNNYYYLQENPLHRLAKIVIAAKHEFYASTRHSATLRPGSGQHCSCTVPHNKGLA